MPADSLLKARTPEPTGHGGHNWLTRLKPGNRGEQPAYIQHIVHALMTKRGMPQARAEAIAVSAPKRWLKSRHADKGTKAASALAVGQWEKDRALSRLHRAGKAAATMAAEEPITVSDTAAICDHEVEVLEAMEEALTPAVLEAAVARVRWADYLPLSPREHVLDELAERAAVALTIIEATRTRELGSGKFTNYLKKISAAPGAGDCPKCGALKLPDKMCPACEAPMAGHKAASLAEAVADVLEEAELGTKARKELPKSAFAIPEKAPGSGSYPIHDLAHARNALARSSGKPEEARVKAAVYKRYPELKPSVQEAESRIAAPFHIEHGGKKLHATAHAMGWTPSPATAAHLKTLDRSTRSSVEGRMRDAGERAHAAAAKARGKLREADEPPIGRSDKGAFYMLRREGGVSHFKNGRPAAIGRSRKGEKGIHASVIDGPGRTKDLGHFSSHGAAHTAIVAHFRKHGKVSEAERLHFRDEWSHLPAHKRPNATALEAARRVSPNKGKSDMVARDRKAFGKALTGVKLTSDEHASARAHAIRTSQLPALRKARHGKLTETERLLIESEIDGAKPTPHAGMLDRVKGMNLGDTVRLPSGHAITHVATPDGRQVWRADTPSRWSSSGWSLGDEKRTPEAAVSDAFRLSAASNDPASLGGASRYHSYSRVKVGGKEHRFVGVDAHTAKPEVRDISGVGQPGSIKVVGWDELHPVDDIMQQGDGGGVMGAVLDGRLQEADRARRDTIGAIAGKGGPKDTFDFHAKGGKFTKGRAQIHGGMIRHVLDNPKAHDSGPVAMVATRSPGGGAVHTVKGAGSAIPHDAVHISIPAMRERVPEHAALKLHSSADETAATDREARHVGKLAATMALMRGKSVVVHDDPIQEASTGQQRQAYTRLRSLGASHADAMRRAARG